MDPVPWDCTPKPDGTHNDLFAPARDGEPVLQPVVLPGGADGLLTRSRALSAAVLALGSVEDVPEEASVSGNGGRSPLDLLGRDDTRRLREPVRHILDSLDSPDAVRTAALEAARSLHGRRPPWDLVLAADDFMARVVRASWREPDQNWPKRGSFWAVMRDQTDATGLVTNPRTGGTAPAWNDIYETVSAVTWRKLRGHDGSIPARLADHLDRAGFSMDDTMHVIATVFTGDPTVFQMAVMAMYLLYSAPGLAEKYRKASLAERSHILAQMIVARDNFAYARTRVLRQDAEVSGVRIPAGVPVVPSLWAMLDGAPAGHWRLSGGGGPHGCPSLGPGFARLRALLSAMALEHPGLRVEASSWPPGLLSVPPHVWAYPA